MIETPEMSALWVKPGTKIYCKEELSVDNPFVQGRPFLVKPGRECVIAAIGPAEVRGEEGWVSIEDVMPADVVVGWFDFGNGKRSGFINQMRGDFMYYWKPLSVVLARERPNRAMILDQHLSQKFVGVPRCIGYWASCADPDADSYIQKGVELPWPGDFIDESWDANERAMVVKYLKKGEMTEQWLGESRCRLCSEPNGAEDLSDAHYTWPSGFAHYVEEHGVKPAAEFINHVWRANGVMTGCFE